MQVVPDQREYDDERTVDPVEPPRLGGTDVFRGGMVILVAVLIGAFVMSRGLDEPDDTTAAGSITAEDELDPAAAATDPDASDEATPESATPATTGDQQTSTTAPTAGTSTDGSVGGTDATSPATVAATDPTAETSTPLSTARPPAEVQVLVLNGAGTQGIAARGTAVLEAAAYPTAAPKNADQLGPSVIYYTEGFELEARAVASVFGPGLDGIVTALTADNQPIDDLQGAAVVVVLGNDGLIAVP